MSNLESVPVDVLLEQLGRRLRGGAGGGPPSSSGSTSGDAFAQLQMHLLPDRRAPPPQPPVAYDASGLPIARSSGAHGSSSGGAATAGHASSSSNSTDRLISSLQATVADLRRENADLRADAASYRHIVGDLERQLHDKDAVHRELQRKLYVADAQLRQLQQQHQAHGRVGTSSSAAAVAENDFTGFLDIKKEEEAKDDLEVRPPYMHNPPQSYQQQQQQQRQPPPLQHHQNYGHDDPEPMMVRRVQDETPPTAQRQMKFPVYSGAAAAADKLLGNVMDFGSPTGNNDNLPPPRSSGPAYATNITGRLSATTTTTGAGVGGGSSVAKTAAPAAATGSATKPGPTYHSNFATAASGASAKTAAAPTHTKPQPAAGGAPTISAAAAYHHAPPRAANASLSSERAPRQGHRAGAGDDDDYVAVESRRRPRHLGEVLPTHAADQQKQQHDYWQHGEDFHDVAAANNNNRGYPSSRSGLGLPPPPPKRGGAASTASPYTAAAQQQHHSDFVVREQPRRPGAAAAGQQQQQHHPRRPSPDDGSVVRLPSPSGVAAEIAALAPRRGAPLHPPAATTTIAASSASNTRRNPNHHDHAAAASALLSNPSSRSASRGTRTSPAPRNPLRGADVDRLFVASMLRPEELDEAHAIVARLGQRGRFVDVEPGVALLPGHVTHVIVSAQPQSPKAFVALVTGRNAVSLAYLRACDAVGYWVDERHADGVFYTLPTWPLRGVRFTIMLHRTQSNASAVDDEQRVLEDIIEAGHGVLVPASSRRSSGGEAVVVLRKGDDLREYIERCVPALP